MQKERRQTLGNMTFIGELYHRSMLTAKIMHSCVIGLLKNATDDEESLESLCKLLTTIGKKLESDKKSEFYNKIEEYYAQLEMLTQKPKLASRYRFMILDLLDLRKVGKRFFWEYRDTEQWCFRIIGNHVEKAMDQKRSIRFIRKLWWKS